MKILVVSRERAEEILTSEEVSQVGAVISIAGPATTDSESRPADWSKRPDGLDSVEKKLLLSFDDVTEPTAAAFAGYHCPQPEDVEAALKFGLELELGDKSLLIHCMAGKSRSVAISLMLFAQELGPGKELEAQIQMFHACEEDWLMPNKLLIGYADFALRRNGALKNIAENFYAGSMVRKSDCLPDQTVCQECRVRLGLAHQKCSRPR